MLGETIRNARIRKGLTQAKLARLAGVSRRHLAALEKGANVSVAVLRKVAAVLELAEIQLGDLSLRAGEKEQASVNVALLTDTIREARAEAMRANATLARAEDLLGRPSNGDFPLHAAFPTMPIRHLEKRAAAATPSGDRIAEGTDWQKVRTAGELRQGGAIDESKTEDVAIPRSLVEEGEIVFRARGHDLSDQGIADGDLLVVELRPRGRASSGELVIARIGKIVYVGRWWQKHGQKSLRSNGLSEVTMGKSARSMKIVAAINQVVRGL